MLHPSGEHHVQTATAPPSATTQTSTATPPLSPSLRIPARAPDGTLRLRGGPIEDRRVRWDQDVIDNEGMGKKKSKVCCIYHPQREFGESSSEEDSSSDDDSSDESDDSGHRSHSHRRGEACGSGNGRGGAGKHGHPRKIKKNAYEKMPKPSTSKRQS